MENTAKHLTSPSDFYIPYFETENKVIYIGIPIMIKTYGQDLFSAPLVLINYGVTKAVSEKSDKIVENIIGDNKIINPKNHTILEFKIDGESNHGFAYESYRHFSKKDMDSIISLAINHFNLPEPQLIYNL